MTSQLVITHGTVSSGDCIPAPWNFVEADLDNHFPEIQDQLVAMVQGWADRVEVP